MRIERRRAALGAALLLVLVLTPTLPARGGIEVLGQRIADEAPWMSDNVDLLATVPLPASIGANFRDDVMFVTGVSGLATFDISNPAQPLPLGVLPMPHFENEDVSLGGDTLIISADTAIGVNYLGVIDVSDPGLPKFRRLFSPEVDTHTATCVNPHPEPDPRNCAFAFLAGGRGLAVLDTARGVIVAEGVAREAGGSHDVQIDSAGIAWVAGSGGTAGYDISDPRRPRLVAKTDANGATGPLNDFIHHNSQRPDIRPGVPGNVVLITEEDYLHPDCDGEGLFQTWQITGPLDPASPAVLVPLDDWSSAEGSLPEPQDKSDAAYFCSSHYFDNRAGVAAVAWYGNGTRFLDVSRPTDITQSGWFVPPAGEIWATYWSPGDASIAYVVDFAAGIHVVRFDRTRPPGSAAADRPPLQPESSTSQPHPEFGWSCRLPLPA